jgi:glycosyltransferase involved in cell wall biosynthesis
LAPRLLYLVGTAGIPLRGPSGSSAHIRGITSGFAEIGWDVLAVGALLEDRRGCQEAPQVPHLASGAASWPSWLDRSRWGWRRELRTARRVARLALRHADGAGLVIERHSLFSDAGLRISARLDVPLILEVDAPPVLERARFERPVDPATGLRWERDVLRAAPRIAAVSTWLCRWLVDEVGCDAKAVRHVPNGVSPAAGDRRRGRSRLSLPEDAFVLGFLGSFQPWHGVGALPGLLRAIPDARLLLVGADREGRAMPPDWPSDLAGRVVAAGRVTEAEVADLVAAMDVGLAPYPPDAPPWFCPLKVLSYRAQGTPVVGTDVADLRLLTGQGGSVVPPGQADALADAVQSWRGRRSAPSLRSWAAVASALLVPWLAEPVGDG